MKSALVVCFKSWRKKKTVLDDMIVMKWKATQVYLKRFHFRDCITRLSALSRRARYNNVKAEFFILK